MARFLKAPETSRARKAIFSQLLSHKGEVYAPDTPCMKGTSHHIEILLWFYGPEEFRAGAFEKRSPELQYYSLSRETMEKNGSSGLQ